MPKTKLNVRRIILVIIVIKGVSGKLNIAMATMFMIIIYASHIIENKKNSLISSHSFLKIAISAVIPRTNITPPEIQKPTGSLYGHCTIV